MKLVTIQLNEDEYMLLKEIIASEFTNLETDEEAVLWSIAMTKLCLEEAKAFTDRSKRSRFSTPPRDIYDIEGIPPVVAREIYDIDGIPPDIAPSPLENPLPREIYDIEGIPPVIAPSPMENPTLEYLVRETLAKAKPGRDSTAFHRGSSNLKP